MSSAKWRPSCLGLNVFNLLPISQGGNELRYLILQIKIYDALLGGNLVFSDILIY